MLRRSEQIERAALVLWTILVFGLELPAQHPRYPRKEVFVGFSYANVDAIGLDSRKNSFGAAGSFTRSLWKGLGLTAEVAVQGFRMCLPNIIHYSNARTMSSPMDIPISYGGLGPTFYCDPNEDELFGNSFQFLSGPQYTLRSTRINYFVHGLFGAVRTAIPRALEYTEPTETEVGLVSRPIRSATTATKWAMGFGGGIDIECKQKRARRYAFRAFQFNYIPAGGDEAWLSNFRVSVGFLIRFGDSVK